MRYTNHYASPLGEMLLEADTYGLTGLWFADQKYFACSPDEKRAEKKLPVLEAAAQWLSVYFSGREPEFSVPLHLMGTDFQKEVWQILLSIPYGKTTTYGKIAKEIAKKRRIARMSAQAVGQAVGHNPVSVIVPCHRVVGSDGRLTGYAGGLDKKEKLLALEGVVPGRS